MPARTSCVRCGVVGFVRWEHVLTAGHAFIEYYCGHCQHSWKVDDSDPRAQKPSKGEATDDPHRDREDR